MAGADPYLLTFLSPTTLWPGLFLKEAPQINIGLTYKEEGKNLTKKIPVYFFFRFLFRTPVTWSFSQRGATNPYRTDL
jgi:hypothetical protein